jgi:hypothetical protein
VPASLLPGVPAGVRLLEVRDGPSERRRMLLARVPGAPPSPAAAHLAEALRATASGFLSGSA